MSSVLCYITTTLRLIIQRLSSSSGACIGPDHSASSSLYLSLVDSGNGARITPFVWSMADTTTMRKITTYMHITPIPLWNNNFTTECILRRHLGLMPGKTGLQLSIFTSFHCILSTFAYGLPIYTYNILTYMTYITEYSHTEINTSQDD